MKALQKPVFAPLLTIAGFDPSSGAGVTADLATFAAHRRFGTSAITALTVQNTLGVRRTEPVSAEILRETLATLAEDLPPAGIKVGMLATEANVRVVAEFLRSLPGIAVVVDPVIRSSSGAELLSPAGVEALREQLLPLATWITPNERELALLAGVDEDDLEALTHKLAGSYPSLGIVATGGDSNPPNDLVRSPQGELLWLHGERIETTSTHGTGCAFSSALLCALTEGLPWTEAAAHAKAYVAESLRQALPRGKGRGPMHLLWPLSPPF